HSSDRAHTGSSRCTNARGVPWRATRSDDDEAEAGSRVVARRVGDVARAAELQAAPAWRRRGDPLRDEWRRQLPARATSGRGDALSARGGGSDATPVPWHVRPDQPIVARAHRTEQALTR